MPTSAPFSDLVREHAGVQIVDMNARDWLQELLQLLTPPFVTAPPGVAYRGEVPLQQVLAVARDQLEARVAVVEPYVSTDWNEEYSQLYSRAFREVPRLAQRIHFFSLPRQDARLTYEDLFSLPPEWRDSYVGYAVVRPLQAFRVGDTVLANPCLIGGTGPELVHCHARFEVSLLANDLHVTGMPFLQQETAVGACAVADMWMIARYLNRKGETRRYRPAEVTTLATKTFVIGPPRQGLADSQMLDALRQMDLNPFGLYPDSPQEARELIYTCVESELPVIVAIPGHVVVAIGHTYEDVLEVTSGTNSMSDLVKSFIVHDDAAGPYRELPLASVVPDQQLGDEYLALDGEPVDFCLVAFPPRVLMTWQDVRDMCGVWLVDGAMGEYAAANTETDPTELWSPRDLETTVFRIYLRLSSDFKRDLLRAPPDERRHRDLIDRYLCMPMPKYVWVVELATR